jgi:hypothetical protein
MDYFFVVSIVSAEIQSPLSSTNQLLFVTGTLFFCEVESGFLNII